MSEINRRKFIQLSVIGSAVAATGCQGQSRYDDRIYRAEALGTYGGYNDRVLPYVNQPDGTQDGVPQYFATVCQMCPAGCGLFARTLGGRAHKVEGNPDHPVNGGKTCARGQAALQHLYDPARLRFPLMRNGRGKAPEQTDWDTAIARTVASLQSAKGRTAILTDALTIGRMPTLSRLIGQFAKGNGAKVVSYSLLDDAPWRAAAQAVYGKNQLPAYRLDEADYILAFSSNFLEAWPSPVYYSRLFGEFRQGTRRKQGEHGRFVYIGPRMSATAAKADKWIPCHPGTEFAVAQGILTALGGAGISVADAAAASGLTEKQITDIANAFRAAGPRAVAFGGDILASQPYGTAAMIAVESLNAVAHSQCVGFGQAALPLVPQAQSGFRKVQSLIRDIQAGRVGALLVVGQPNPVFTLPKAAGFTEALAGVPFIAALTPFEDETTDHADVLLPTRTFMEDWGDDIPVVIPPAARMATLRQPIIDPQFVTDSPGLEPADYTHDAIPWMDTRPTGDIFLDLAQRLGHPLPYTDTRHAVRHTWAGIKQADLNAQTTDNDPAWIAALSKGGFWTQTMPVAAVGSVITPSIAAPALSLPKDTFALQLFPHIYWTDGRHSNLSWMQECADPMTSAVWNTWAEINLQTAEQMGIRTGDILRLTTAQGHIDVPAVPSPGIHPNVIAMPIGQGHTRYGAKVTRQGSNPLSIITLVAEGQTGALAYNATTVKVQKLRSAQHGYHPEVGTLVLTQDRPGGPEPEAVQDLIHTTAKEWKKAKPVQGAPQAAGSIFNRGGSVQNPPMENPGE